MYEPEYLNRWTLPKDYFGDTWYDYYGSGCGRSRDSDCLERANFQAMLAALNFTNEIPSDDCPTINDEYTRNIIRENHWLVGWVEWIAIHETDTKGLKIADKIIEAKQDYPIIDEDLFCQIEENECEQVWSNCYDDHERIQYLRDHCTYIEGNFRQLRSACKGDWYEAGNLLNSPSDLIY